jgi:hypothetical protein
MRLILAFALLIAAPTPRAHAAQGTNDVEIVGLDYAFQIPARIPAGRTTIRFVNRGKFAHELNIALLKRGTTMQQFVAASNAGQPLIPLVEAPIGVVFAEPGAAGAGRLVTDLLPDREYALRCIFKDSASAPRHFMLGMYASIHVDGGRAPETSPVRADTIVAMDYAFRAPTHLAPGRHRLAFVNAGKQRHEVSLALLAKGVSLQQVMRDVAAGRDSDDWFESGLGVLHTPGGSSPAGLLEVDLLPGREYLIVCDFSDTPTSPHLVVLGMFGGITVGR